MRLPAVSIIIPTHSRPHLLPLAVESALQAGTDIEVIVVDDASTDATATVCQKLAGIRYLRVDRNQGVAGARNIGIAASKSDYIAFLDDDDLRLPGSINLQLDILAANPQAGLVYSPVLLADQDGEMTGTRLPAACPSGDVFWELLELKMTILLQAAIVRRECFTRVGLLNSGLSGIDDWDISVRIAELYPFAVFEEPVVIYREPTPFSGQGASAPMRLCELATRHQPQLLKLPRAATAAESRRRTARNNLRRQVTRNLLWHAAAGLPAGANRAVRANLMTALRLNPLGAARPGVLKLWLQTLMPTRGSAAS